MLLWNENDFDEWTNKIILSSENNKDIILEILNNVEILKLNNSNTHFLSYYVYEMINLMELQITNGLIDFISPNIKKLQKLQKLIFNNTLIYQLPEKIETLQNLYVIDCSFNCNFTIISPNIKYLQNLQIFNCNNCKISVIPSEIGFLVNLKKFNCSNNEIKELPNELNNLILLKDLDCSDNQITFLPDFTNLINLVNFNFSGNHILKFAELLILKDLVIPQKQLLTFPKQLIYYSDTKDMENRYLKLADEIKNIQKNNKPITKCRVKKISKEFNSFISSMASSNLASKSLSEIDNAYYNELNKIFNLCMNGKP